MATDIAPEAVALARDNVSALDLGDRVEVLSCDLGEAARLAEEAGFSDVRVTADLAGRPRVLTARKRAV